MNRFKLITLSGAVLWALLGTPSLHAASSTPCVVPLQLVTSTNGLKLGILVGLGDGTPQLYEFDTGGKGFWAAYAATPAPSKPQWWSSFTPVPNTPLTTVYTSGNSYTASLVNTAVGLYSSASASSPVCGSSAPLGVAQISSYSDPNNPDRVAAWNQGLANGTPPLFGYFYGDFGAALSPAMSTGQTTMGTYSVLPQIVPSGLINGFIVHVGALGQNTAASLQVGITDSDLRSFSTLLTMNPSCNNQNTTPVAPSWCNNPPYTNPPYPAFPVSGVPTYNEQVANATISWQQNNKSQLYPTGLTLDTGAPATQIWQNNQIQVDNSFLSQPQNVSGTSFYSGSFNNNITFQYAAQGNSSAQTACPTNLFWSFPTGSTQSVNQVAANARPTSGAESSMSSGYINTGIMMYSNYDIMFDLTDGVVGFRPINTASLNPPAGYTANYYAFPSGASAATTIVASGTNTQYFNGPLNQVYAVGSNSELAVSSTTLPPITATGFQQLYTIAIQGLSSDWNVSGYHGLITLTSISSGRVLQFRIPQPPQGANNYGVDVQFTDGSVAFTGNTSNCAWSMWLTQGGQNAANWGNYSVAIPATGNTPLSLSSYIVQNPAALNRTDNSSSQSFQ